MENPSFIHSLAEGGGRAPWVGRLLTRLLFCFSPCLPLTSQWDAFSIPELQNFLTILEKEEQDKIQQVQKKYDKFRQKLEEALRKSQGKPG